MDNPEYFIIVGFVKTFLISSQSFQIFGNQSSGRRSALIAAGRVPAIRGGRGDRTSEKAKKVGVGKRGSIIISKRLVEGLGISAEDKFTVRKTKAGIALKKTG